MGTRDDLLAAAKQCLAERGYARTTVRDIVSASGSNLAAINYHFGTRDALLNQAMVESTTEAVQRILDATTAGDAAEPDGRLAAFLRQLTITFTEDRALWAANIESLAQALHSGDVRNELSAKQLDARRSLAGMLLPDESDPDDDIGAVLLTLLDGMLIQWLLAPSVAPDPDRLVAGLRGIVRAIDARKR
ncbi:TetR/AcrR family transcriptional regulator [Nocardia blacklockiae]|uniref:TetR/AcrR family transcriptional regulator n=1 Tax=Nocardia blacklockiae TaxID=480036 RepID=UPI0018960B7B|nr:TetR/AcrR family transcriptional regulator [Nocardia blacklockiae]MBF6172951.1 TetR/AcrR family transcriptional regulator [Nocardia blacklockiae]